jgi:hypothetical protein
VPEPRERSGDRAAQRALTRLFVAQGIKDAAGEGDAIGGVELLRSAAARRKLLSGRMVAAVDRVTRQAHCLWTFSFVGLPW